MIGSHLQEGFTPLVLLIMAYRSLCGEALPDPDRSTFFRLQVCKRVQIFSQVEADMK